MRVRSSVTSISWIPSEAVTGMSKALFGTGIAHYDAPPPDTIDDLGALRDADGFRFANHLSAWVDVEEGRVVEAGYDGGGLMGATTVALFGRDALRLQGVAFPDLRAAPDVGPDEVRFLQTTGGRTAFPAPRHVRRPPFVQLTAPTVWTTLALTIHADGSAEHALVGASRFPRHWVFDAASKLVEKVGLADFAAWYRMSFGKHTPWGEADSPALVTAVESALERELATRIMRGGEKPEIRNVKRGAPLTRQGEPGDELYLLLDGIVRVDVDGEALAELGPGAVLGERAVLERGRRTSTVTAVTKARVAVVRGDQVDRSALHALSADHRREENR